MRTIVLVHGAWHGTWCWAAVLAGLDELEIPAVAVELPLTDLDADVTAVTKALDEVEGPIVLVGHSYGGAVVTGAGVHPRVERLAYLAAFTPDADETVIGLALDQEDQGELGHAIVIRDDGTSVLDLDLVGEVLYADCDPVDVERAKRLLRPQSGITLSQPPPAVAWREKPTTYVVCGADRGVPPSLQRAMAERIPGAAVVEWPGASHSPFLSRPKDVVALLAGLA